MGTGPTTTDTDGLVMLKFAPAGDKNFPITYTNYKKCFTDVLSKSVAATPTTDAEKSAAATKKKIAAFIKGNGIAILSDFEAKTKYDCAGFCKVPLFYATRDMSERPTRECIRPIVESFSKVAGVVSIVSFISFLANFCGFCGSFALCTKMEGNDDDK